MKMKIRDADNIEKKREVKEVPKHLFDVGMLDGIEIDPADNEKQVRPSRLQASTSLASSLNIPDSKVTGEGEEWVRQQTPSLGVPYGIKELWVRPLTVPMLAKVHAAQLQGEKPDMQQQAFTMLVDSLAPTIKGLDIRDLTVPDFNSHIYWLRLNSYPRSPLTLPWTSRYGNDNVDRINSSNFVFEELKMTREEYLNWNKLGIALPTIRDMELLFDKSLDDETKWTVTYAQYMYLEQPNVPDAMRRKIAQFESMGTDGVSLVNEFSALVSHGVVEQVKVTDKKFEINAAIAYIQEEVNTFTAMLDAATKEASEGDQSLASYLYLINHVKARAAELEKLKAVRDNDGRNPDGSFFQPEQEVVALASANATLLFP